VIVQRTKPPQFKPAVKRAIRESPLRYDRSTHEAVTIQIQPQDFADHRWLTKRFMDCKKAEGNEFPSAFLFDFCEFCK
jgi:hypothetical protein